MRYFLKINKHFIRTILPKPNVRSEHSVVGEALSGEALSVTAKALSCFTRVGQGLKIVFIRPGWPLANIPNSLFPFILRK